MPLKTRQLQYRVNVIGTNQIAIYMQQKNQEFEITFKHNSRSRNDP